MTYARAAHSALPQKSSRITFQPMYANLLTRKLHNMINSRRLEISQKPFPGKNLLKQTIYLLLEAKTTVPISIACVQTRHTIRVTKHMQLNKFLTDQEEPLF